MIAPCQAKVSQVLVIHSPLCVRGELLLRLVLATLSHSDVWSLNAAVAADEGMIKKTKQYPPE